MERLFVDQRKPDELISISALKAEYGNLVASGDLDPLETTFSMHLTNCLEPHGGTLKEVFLDTAEHTVEFLYKNGKHRPCRVTIYYPKFPAYTSDFMYSVILNALERHPYDSYDVFHDYEVDVMEDICNQVHGKWEYDIADTTINVE